MNSSITKSKVVHLITLLEFGGAQGNTIHTATHLNPELFDVELWTGPGAYWDSEILKKSKLKNRVRFFTHLVREVNPLQDFLAIFQLWNALRKFKPDIIHTHSSKAGILGRLAACLAGVPIVIHTFHGFGFNNEQNKYVKGLYVFLEKFVARFTDTLIFVSESNRNWAEELKIGNPTCYELIRSGVPINSIKEIQNTLQPQEVRKSLNIPFTSKVLITISAFKPQKNLDDFIDTAMLINNKIKDVYYIVVGDGVLRPSLEKKIKELGLENQFRMTGWRQDVPALLAQSDVFVLTSLWEGLPRALVEALILGRPSVCYDTDGVRDLLSIGGGVLIPQKRPDLMSLEIIKLLTNSAYWTQLSRDATQLIGLDFDIDEMVKRQENLYLKVLNSKRSE
jgi:glycosyltransferase involved in cell wall biosynthesis